MRLSIVIPALNEAERIGINVQRAIALQPTEVIVVDGGSDDGTTDIAKSAGAVVLTGPRGRGCQLNLGSRVATGDVLLFLHADCWLEPGSQLEIERALQQPNVAGGAFRQSIDHPGSRFRWLESGNAARARWFGLPFGDQGIFLRRSVLESVGGFAEVRLLEDVLLMQELRRRRHRLALLQGPIHVDPRRWLKHGVLRQTLRNWMLLAGLRIGISPNRLADFYSATPVVCRD